MERQIYEGAKRRKLALQGAAKLITFDLFSNAAQSETF